MSNWRRMHARANRKLVQQRRSNERQRLREVYAGPVDVWTCDGRTALFFNGAETTIRNAAGEVVMADKAPDFLLDLHDYARRITATPQPLSKRVRAKRPS